MTGGLVGATQVVFLYVAWMAIGKCGFREMTLGMFIQLPRFDMIDPTLTALFLNSASSNGLRLSANHKSLGGNPHQRRTTCPIKPRCIKTEA